MDNSLNQITYNQLKKDILSFGLKPGESVSAAKIAERYSVSRTPAREALVKLETEGLVDIIPQSKSVISKINLEKAKQEWFIRKTLELGMLDSFFQNVKSDDIEEMKIKNSLMEELSENEAENGYLLQQADHEFHAITYRVAGEKLSAMVISNNVAHYWRLRFLSETDRNLIKRTIKGHNALINYVSAGDCEGYKRELDKHLTYILSDVQKMQNEFPEYFDAN